MYIQLSSSAADEQRSGVEKIQGPIRNNRPWHKWNVMLPTEDKRRNLGAQTCYPVCESIGKEKERRKARQPECRERPGGLLDQVFSSCCNRGGHQWTLCAKATVKMPHSSVSWSILRKPARWTNWSSSACVRRRMIHGLPPRWLDSVRAISSSCGCQGWPV